VIRDLLKDLQERRLTPEDAEREFLDVLDSERGAEVYELFGLSDPESTAYGHGVPFEELAEWRYEGWPSTCARCGRPIDVEAYGWFAGEEREGNSVLVHIKCPRNEAASEPTRGRGLQVPEAGDQD
jgi:hypothetical protein